MASQRTQIYLSVEQRAALDELRMQRGQSLAELIRAAVDRYLENEQHGRDDVYKRTFGAIPGLERPPRSEWEERERRVWGE